MRRLACLCLVPLAFFAASCRGGSAQAQGDPKPKPREIKVTDLKVGTGNPVDEADLVMVEYEGRFPDSQVVFDSNTGRDDKGEATKAPLPVLVGAGGIVKGLDQGLVGMRLGGEREIFVPWELGYGEKGKEDGSIPPKQDMVFKVKILDVVKLGEEDIFDSTDTKVGSGREVKDGDKVTLHYRGTYANGMRFDNSRERGPNGTPLVFRVGMGHVIKGLDAGVVGMKVGGKRRLRLPPMLVYGSQGYSAIQGNQVCYFDLELLKIE